MSRKIIDIEGGVLDSFLLQVPSEIEFIVDPDTEIHRGGSGEIFERRGRPEIPEFEAKGQIPDNFSHLWRANTTPRFMLLMFSK